MIDGEALTHEELDNFGFTVTSRIIEWRLFESVLLLNVYAILDQIFHHGDYFLVFFGTIVDTCCGKEEILSVLRLVSDIPDFDGVPTLFGLQIGDFTGLYGIYYGFADLRSDVSSCGTNCLPRSRMALVVTVELLL